MSLPYFFSSVLDNAEKEIMLDEETSRHLIQVLRKKTGERFHLTDGKGNLALAVITEEHRKHCAAKIESLSFYERADPAISIGISLIKNTARFEWFLEKAGEIGITEVYPLICERTEKEKFRMERMQQILISAMLQSQQVWMPVLYEPVKLDSVIRSSSYGNRLIAHCSNAESKTELSEYNLGHDVILLIGPEGDFTDEEIALALANGYQPVSIGETRLRTETAGVVGATILKYGKRNSS